MQGLSYPWIYTPLSFGYRAYNVLDSCEEVILQPPDPLFIGGTVRCLLAEPRDSRVFDNRPGASIPARRQGTWLNQHWRNASRTQASRHPLYTVVVVVSYNIKWRTYLYHRSVDTVDSNNIPPLIIHARCQPSGFLLY